MGVQQLEHLLVELDDVLRWLDSTNNHGLKAGDFWEYEISFLESDINSQVQLAEIVDSVQNPNPDYWEHSGAVQALYAHKALGKLNIEFTVDVESLMTIRNISMKWVRNLGMAYAPYLEEKLGQIDYQLPEFYEGEISEEVFIKISYPGLVPNSLYELTKFFEKFSSKVVKDQLRPDMNPQEAALKCYNSLSDWGLDYGFEYAVNGMIEVIDSFIRNRRKFKEIYVEDLANWMVRDLVRLQISPYNFVCRIHENKKRELNRGWVLR